MTVPPPPPSPTTTPSRMNIPHRHDRMQALDQAKSLEETIDRMAQDLTDLLKGRARSSTDQENFRVMAVLRKASSYAYCAHATLLEIKSAGRMPA